MRKGTAAAVAVVGAGAWGTTLAILLGRRERTVLVARRADHALRMAVERENRDRLPAVAFPARLEVIADPQSIGSASLVVLAVPSAFLRETVARLAPLIGPDAVVLSVVKGIEGSSLLRMSQVVAEAGSVSPSRVAVLSGPNLAREIARGLPASSVVAAEDERFARDVRDRVGTRFFRLYTNTDVVGVELAGALKNVVAIAAGAADALGFGDNGKAALVTRGLAEITRLGVAAGGSPLTFAGLAGLGDLVATCQSPLSRNHRLGAELARGRAFADIARTLDGVAEGAYTVDAAIALAERHGVDVPIAREVHLALFERKPVRRCLTDLLARETRDELADRGAWHAALAGDGASGDPPGVARGPS